VSGRWDAGGLKTLLIGSNPINHLGGNDNQLDTGHKNWSTPHLGEDELSLSSLSPLDKDFSRTATKTEERIS